MYCIIPFISIIVRQFLLPNPFEPLGDVSVHGAVWTPETFNLVAGFVLPSIAFLTTRIYYDGGEHAVGSLLFLFFYCMYVGMLHLMSLAHFAWWAVALIIVGYIGLHFAYNRWSDGIRGADDERDER